jgi:hypothetical protein
MTDLAELSSSGNLSSFAGIFRVSALSEGEKESLHAILKAYGTEGQEIAQDLDSLAVITSEVKAINNQAAILHGERIKKAQEILKGYRDGAFTAWLVAAYGNRQTPYNFLQYYELYRALPHMLHPKLDEMPRQAVYTLASRQGTLEKKEEIVRNYRGEPKQELIAHIRETFPLAHDDGRAQDFGALAITALARLQRQLACASFAPTAEQRDRLRALLHSLHALIDP